MELSIELSHERKREEIRILIDGLSAYAKECKGLSPTEVVALFWDFIWILSMKFSLNLLRLII